MHSRDSSADLGGALPHEVGAGREGFFVHVDEILAETLEYLSQDFDGASHLNDTGFLDGRSEHDHIGHTLITYLPGHLSRGYFNDLSGCLSGVNIANLRLVDK